MNIVVTGHVDHGKSTLIGRLLYDSGSIPDSKISEVQATAQELKGKFEFAYFLDAFADEMQEERTIDTTEVVFKGKYLHTLIDVPGHREFIEAMLTGASHAEAAIVVVDVTMGIEEQTRRHINLIKLLGIRDIIVLVNKMDLVNYSYNSFKSIETEIMNDFGSPITIPISAREGKNIFTKCSEMSMWTPWSLVDYLDRLHERKLSKPSPNRFIVQGVYKDLVLGTGQASRGDTLVFSPSGLSNLIEEKIDPGILLMSTIKPIERGEVGSDKLLTPAKSITAQIFVLEGTVKEKDILTLRCGTKTVRCSIKKIIKVLDSETSLEVKSNKLSKHTLGMVNISTNYIVVENLSVDPELGRLILSKNNKIVGVGVVISYEKELGYAYVS